LLAACGAFLRVVVEAALETACRRGGILDLRWHQVQLNRQPDLVAGRQDEDGAGATGDCLDPAQGNPRDSPRCPTGEMLPGNLFVFGNEIGQRHGAIKTAWRLACARAKPHDFRFHDLRREAGSRWMEAGVPLATIQRWLGHTNIAQTSVYLSTTPAGEHDAMRRNEERIGRLTRIDTDGETPPHDEASSAEVRQTNPQQNTVRH
jgi:integrase